MPLLDLGQITRETLDQLARAGHVQPLLGSGPAGEVLLDPAPAAPADENEQSRGSHPRLGSDPSLGIALEAAPRHFFDQDRWNEFISYRGCHEKALHRISYPDPAALIGLRLLVARQQTSDAARAREEDRIYRLGQSLVEDFRSGLMSGQYIATAFQPPSIERVTIPAELHRELILNFVEGVAKSSDYIFTHVRIIKAADVARQGSDILMRIAAWLIERRAQWGDELKKTLSQAARIEFGSRCTERVFAAAYGQIYSRKRGRPPIQRG